jgi:hypothetical protein
MRLLQLFVLVTAALNASAFATKKREPTRPAFKAALANGNNAVPGVQSEQEVAREEQLPVFAFAGQAMVPVQVVHYDDDAVIGYTTGLLACIVSLALGFSLGYGAI